MTDPALEWHEGSPDLLLLLAHATGFCKEVWRPVVHELRKWGVGATVLAWDAGGHGSADLIETPVTWWTFGQDLAVLSDRLNFPGSVVGVGHSMGGTAVAMLDILRPGLMAGMVLVEPVIIPPPYRRSPDFPLAVRAARRRSSFPSRKAVADIYRSKPLFRRWHPDAFDGYLEGALRDHPDGVVLACPPEIEAEIFATGTDTRMFDRLDDLAAPVRLLVTDHSGGLERFIRALEGKITNSTTSYLTGDTHMVVMENPDRVAAEIVDFLRRLPNVDEPAYPKGYWFPEAPNRSLGRSDPAYSTRHGSCKPPV